MICRIGSLFSGTDPFKAGKRIGTRKPHPSNIPLRVTRGSPWVNDVSHEPTGIIIDLLVANDAIIGLQDSFGLLLNCQSFVVGKCISEGLVRTRNLTRVVRHYGRWRLREIGFWIEA